SIAFTVQGLGPFTARTVPESLVALETFTYVVAITTLLLAAATTARGTAEAEMLARSTELDQALGELRSANDAISTRRQMTAEIVHELRNPLTTILGFSRALYEGDVSVTPERLAAIVRQTERLGQIISDLRMLTLADVGNLPLEIRPVAVAEIV